MLDPSTLNIPRLCLYVFIVAGCEILSSSCTFFQIFYKHGQPMFSDYSAHDVRIDV